MTTEAGKTDTTMREAEATRWDDAERWRRAGLRRDGKPLTDRGRRRVSGIAHSHASQGAHVLSAAAMAAPTREDAAFIFGMCLGELAQHAPNERAAQFLRMALTACFDEAYPERKVKAA